MLGMFHCSSLSEGCIDHLVRSTYVCSVLVGLAILTSGCQITFDKGRLSITDVPPPTVEPEQPVTPVEIEDLKPPKSVE